MKSVFDMSGVERAAALLVALGPQIAADIMKHLDEESIELISREIARIDMLSTVDREELVGEFIIQLKKEKRRLKAGESRARSLLVDAFGEERARDIMLKFSGTNINEKFDTINDIEDELLVRFLGDEHPQTIAVALHYLKPEKAAVILKSLESDSAKDVAVRMAKMQSVNPEAVAGIIKTIKEKYKKHSRDNQGVQAGGVDSLVEILNRMGGEDERKLMDNLDMSMPDVSQQIRERVFNFENVVNLTNTEIRVVIDEINDDHLIAMALKGAGDEIRFKFLRNMSQNRATDILTDMDALGPVRLSEVDDCRNKIVSIMRGLHDNGVISLILSDDVYIE